MSKYPTLDFARYQETTLDVHETLAVAVLQNSAGLPTMSEEDMKIAIISLINTCTKQQTVIDELVNCVNELRDTTKTKRTKKH